MSQAASTSLAKFSGCPRTRSRMVIVSPLPFEQRPAVADIFFRSIADDPRDGQFLLIGYPLKSPVEITWKGYGGSACRRGA